MAENISRDFGDFWQNGDSSIECPQISGPKKKKKKKTLLYVRDNMSVKPEH